MRSKLQINIQSSVVCVVCGVPVGRGTYVGELCVIVYLYGVCFPVQLVWIFVFLATVLLGVDLGLLAGVLFSLSMVLLQIIL